MTKNIFAGKWEFHVSARPSAMTPGQFEDQWPQIRRHARAWWSNLSEDDLDQVAGNFEQFLDLLQAKYGYTPEQAKKEFNQRVAEL